jgi:hypothetical protein
MDDEPIIYNHPGRKTKSVVWKHFGFFKKQNAVGGPTVKTLDMERAVCKICKKLYINKGKKTVFDRACLITCFRNQEIKLSSMTEISKQKSNQMNNFIVYILIKLTCM